MLRRFTPARWLAAFMVLLGLLVTGPGGAVARSAQVCTGPQNLLPPPQGCFTIDTSVIGGRAFEDYVVTRPGSLYFELPSRRQELTRLSPDTAALYCAANPAARTRTGLPTLTFFSSQLRLHTQQGNDNGIQRVQDVARLTLDGLHTDDGLNIPSLEVAMHRERGNGAADRLSVLFYENGPGPPVTGLHTVWFHVDVVTGEFTHPRFVTLPESSRRLAFALVDQLPALQSTAGSVVTTPGPADPAWTRATVIEQSGRFRDGVFAQPQPRFEPIVTLNCSLQGSYQTCTQEPPLRAFADYLRLHGADYLESGSAATAAGLLANLRAWATADALSVIPGIVKGASDQPDFVPKYTLLQFALSTVTTWSLIRTDPQVTAADRELIDGWLDRLAGYAAEPFGGPLYDDMPWNPGYLSAAVRMAWGIVKGRNAAVGQGVERILMGLHQMRRDGSFPRETARGACGLGYQVVQTHHLIVLAELAARQGYDAYALSVDGKSLHDAVKFILDVLDNPALIAGYAAQDATNCNVPYNGSQSMLLPGIVGEGDTPYAWIEHYIARFPGHSNSVRLARLEQGGLAANRPVHNTLSGANTTCFAAARTPIPITPPSTVVRLHTSLGLIDMRLLDTEAPITAANFLAYVRAGDWKDMFFHRSARLASGAPFVLQGGGYRWPAGNSSCCASVASRGPIANEFSASRSNVRGTVAMAKLDTGPNTASNQWFINLGNESATLDPQNGGSTVFARVTVPALMVADRIAALPVGSAFGVFGELPLHNPTSGQAVQRQNLVLVSDVTVLPQAHDSDRIFNYLEAAYPQYLAASTGTAGSALGYTYRYYSGSQAYVGTKDGKVWYLVPAIGPDVGELGSMADWLARAQAAGY